MKKTIATQKHLFYAMMVLITFAITTNVCATDFGKPVVWDRLSLIIGDMRVCPVMGEVHYSRIPADEWQQEVRKMKTAALRSLLLTCFGTTLRSRRVSSVGTDSVISDVLLRYVKMKNCR